MAPYRRRRWRRRWRPRRWWFRKGRRFRQHRRPRTTRRRRVRRWRRRKLATVRQWEPDQKKTCYINGHTFGLISVNPNTTNRLFFTGQLPDGIFLWPEGGGVTLRIFGLDFLWAEHRLFRNCWSQTNDGYDLALYLGTTVYLPPHDNYDYLFWWDTDLTTITEADWYRLHPALALCENHVVFVRNQTKSRNNKTKKVKIRPPANMSNQWMFVKDMYKMPLFAWGMSMINWEEPYLRTQTGYLPIYDFDTRTVYVSQNPPTDSQWKTLYSANQTLAYSPMVDKGIGNEIFIRWLRPGTSPSNETDFPTPHTQDLPYWFSCFGQNTSYNFGHSSKEAESSTPGATIPWIKWHMLSTTKKWLESGTGEKPTLKTYCANATTARMFANMGWFVVSNVKERVNVPLLYRAKFKWGGTNLTKQKVTPFFPNTNQVSVKNPATVGRYVIKPSDLEGGLLTRNALARFLEPSKTIDERRPQPWEEQPPRYASSESDVSTGSEAEESEEEPGKGCSVEEAIRTLRRRIQRERTQRRSLHKFFKSLLKQE
nr:ORF1 [Torque teno felis virus]